MDYGLWVLPCPSFSYNRPPSAHGLFLGLVLLPDFTLARVQLIRQFDKGL